MKTREWWSLVHAEVGRQCPRHWGDEVETDARSALWLHQICERVVASPAGLVTSIVRTEFARLRGQQRGVRITDPAVVDERATAVALDPEWNDEDACWQQAVAVLRGERQRWFVEQLRLGRTCVQMAEALGREVREVARQLRRVAAVIHAHTCA